MDPVNAKANFSRLCRLVAVKGTALHAKHLSFTLSAALNANEAIFKNLRRSVIDSSEWNSLFPAPGTPDHSKDFDVTLLTILVRNICESVHPPLTAWNVVPKPTSNTSISEVSELYQQTRPLADAHFHDLRYSDCRNPKKVLMSLASQICDNIGGFRNKLSEVLCLEHCLNSLFYFRGLPLHDPLHDHPILILVGSKPKRETKANDFACFEENSDGQQLINFYVINGRIRYSAAKKKMIMKHEKMPEKRALKAGNSLHGMKRSGLMTSPREKELEDENLSLKKQLQSLQLKYNEIVKLTETMAEKTAKEKEEKIYEHFLTRQIVSIVKELKDENSSLKKEVESLRLENEEILTDLGQITVEETARENEERKSKHFSQIFHSSLQKNKRSDKSNPGHNRSSNDLSRQSSDPTGSLRPAPVTNKSSNLQILNTAAVDPPSSSRHHMVNGFGPLVQEYYCRPDNNKMVKNDENEREPQRRYFERASTIWVNADQQMETNENIPSIQSGEQSSGGEGNHEQRLASRDEYEDLPFSVQQHDSGRESISLSNIPPASVATTLYNNYKMLLLSMAQNLLSSDVVKLQDWAAQNFSISNSQNATDTLLQLDQKGIINASDLHQLCNFFESITRFDLVHIIDGFLLGEYNLLSLTVRQCQASKRNTRNLSQYQRTRAILRNPAFLNALSTRNLGTSRKPGNNNEAQNSLRQTQPHALRNFSDAANPTTFVSSPRDQSMASTQQNPNKPATGFNSVRMAEVAVANGPITRETRKTTGNAETRTTSLVSNGAGNTLTGSSNGSKHSKFQRPDKDHSPNRNPDLDSNWLCSHYKRHCYVKFDCCDKFWPCHRCHNNQSTCGRKKLKSRDTKMVKCVYCHTVQQFGEHCRDCGAKFANYYCGSCKHLTGTDDHPYHCEKCGICRIHGDRSFHCDVCGVCLDVQLRGNHKCRAGSAHDECFICFEDAFTGCQILPCSHKVHKECANQMIRNGITRCAICRESFAHKLVRRPCPRKRPGK